MAKILIVDDVSTVRKVLRGVLEEEGYAVAEAEDGDTAKSMYASEMPDVVLMDIFMPDGGGANAIVSIRSKDPNAKIIVITAVDGITAGQMKELGAIACLKKPFETKELLTEIKKALQTRTA